MKSGMAELSYSKTSVAVQEHTFLGEEVDGVELSDDYAWASVCIQEASWEWDNKKI